MEAIKNCPELEGLFAHPEPNPKKKITREVLVNQLNYLNFQNTYVIVNLRHKDFGRGLSLNAIPQPCSGNRLQCRWQDPETAPIELTAFELESIVVPMGRDSLFFSPVDCHCNATGISLDLPEFCYKIGSRKLERYRCADISVSLIQNSALFHGKLVDFNALSFCVQISLIPRNPTNG